MIVNVDGLSGLRNAYRSVLSAVGSSEIRGASRWLDADVELGLGANASTSASSPLRPRTMAIAFFIPFALLWWFGVGARSPNSRHRFGPGTENRFVAADEREP